MADLPRCPLCGEPGELSRSDPPQLAACSDCECPASRWLTLVEEWSHRLLEDELRANIQAAIEACATGHPEVGESRAEVERLKNERLDLLREIFVKEDERAKAVAEIERLKAKLTTAERERDRVGADHDIVAILHADDHQWRTKHEPIVVAAKAVVADWIEEDGVEFLEFELKGLPQGALVAAVRAAEEGE